MDVRVPLHAPAAVRRGAPARSPADAAAARALQMDRRQRPRRVLRSAAAGQRQGSRRCNAPAPAGQSERREGARQSARWNTSSASSRARRRPRRRRRSGSRRRSFRQLRARSGNRCCSISADQIAALAAQREGRARRDGRRGTPRASATSSTKWMRDNKCRAAASTRRRGTPSDYCVLLFQVRLVDLDLGARLEAREVGGQQLASDLLAADARPGRLRAWPRPARGVDDLDQLVDRIAAALVGRAGVRRKLVGFA